MFGPRAFKGLHKRVQMIMKEPVKAGFFSQSGGPRVDLDIIFHARFREVNEFGVEYGAPHPTVWIEQGFIDPKDGDLMKIEGKLYRVREIEPESSQYIKLILQDETDVRNF